MSDKLQIIFQPAKWEVFIVHALEASQKVGKHVYNMPAYTSPLNTNHHV